MNEIKPTTKPPISLIPREALIEEAKAFQFGSTKHGRYAFREGVKYSRLIDAALRHILALADGENIDEESGCNHAANARANLGMLLFMMEHRKDMDDRWKKPKSFEELASAWEEFKPKKSLKEIVEELKEKKNLFNEQWEQTTPGPSNDPENYTLKLPNQVVMDGSKK